MSDMNESLFTETQTEAAVLPLPGAALREAREAHGYSLGDVSQAIKFGVRQLEALENDDYSNLKGTTFVRGFVRSYARYLKIDEIPLLQALEPRLPAAVAEVKAVESMDEEMPTQGADIYSRRAYGVAVAVLLLGALAWFAIQVHVPKPAVDQVAAPAPATLAVASSGAEIAPSVPMAPSPAASQAAPAAALPVAVPAPMSVAATPAPPVVSTSSTASTPVSPVASTGTPGERQLVLSFSAESWVEVRDAGQHVIFSGRSPAGSSQSLHGKPPFQLVVGNAPAVKVRYEDHDIDLQPYTRVDVARLTLDDNTK